MTPSVIKSSTLSILNPTQFHSPPLMKLIENFESENQFQFQHLLPNGNLHWKHLKSFKPNKKFISSKIVLFILEIVAFIFNICFNKCQDQCKGMTSKIFKSLELLLTTTNFKPHKEKLNFIYQILSSAKLFHSNAFNLKRVQQVQVIY